jgi:hypothetical protein
VWLPLRAHLRVELSALATTSFALALLHAWNAVPWSTASSSSIGFSYDDQVEVDWNWDAFQGERVHFVELFSRLSALSSMT